MEIGMLLLILARLAFAADNAAACSVCCSASGAPGCPTDLRVVGEATVVGRDGAGWKARGLYVVSCDGRGFFDDTESASFAAQPTPGDAARSSSAQWDCFARSCQLPGTLCFDPGTGHVSMCDGGAAPTAAAFRAAPGPKRANLALPPATPAAAPAIAATPTWGAPVATAPVAAPSIAAAPVAAPPVAPTAWSAPPAGGALTVVVAGRSLTVERADAQAAPVAAPAPRPAPKPSSGVLFDDLDDDDILAALKSNADLDLLAPAPRELAAAPAQPAPAAAPAPVAATPVAAAATSQPAPVAAPAPVTVAPAAAPAAPRPAASPAAKQGAIDQLIAALPKDPPTTCKAPAEALRSQARLQVMAGDDLRLERDDNSAVQKYRAALAMDACNAYAWLGLAESAIGLQRPDLSVRALKNTTTLMPRHYGAWTELGQAYEALGQRALAIDAYRTALTIQANHPAAVAGLQRLGAP